MSYRLNPLQRLQVYLGEDMVFQSVLRDRNNTAHSLVDAGANITFFPYDSGVVALTAALTIDSASGGEVSGTIPAAAVYEALSPGLYRYQVKVAQSGTVLVAESGTLTVLGGSLGPDPAIPEDPPAPVCAWVPIMEAFNVTFTVGDAVIGNAPSITDSIVTGVGVQTDGSGLTLLSYYITIPDMPETVYVRGTIDSFTSQLVDETFLSPVFYIENGDLTFEEVFNENAPVENLITGWTPTPFTGTIGPQVDTNDRGIYYQGAADNDGLTITESYSVLFEVYMCGDSPGVPP